MLLSSVKVVAVTQPYGESLMDSPEEIIAYCARVSSSKDDSEKAKNADGLIRYCIKNKHWSIFEMVNVVLDIETPRDISRQLLRHRSFSFQEFSQRYSSDIKFCKREMRVQDQTNRQNSVDDLTKSEKKTWEKLQADLILMYQDLYKNLIDKGYAKETVRVILPEGLTMSRLFVNGSLRSWLHYLDVRTGNGTQLEHVQLAEQIKVALVPIFPNVFKATENV
jgi:thymidylate synthase (FAD)